MLGLPQVGKVLSCLSALGPGRCCKLNMGRVTHRQILFSVFGQESGVNHQVYVCSKFLLFADFFFGCVWHSLCKQWYSLIK